MYVMLGKILKMKKTVIILLAWVSFGTLSAQQPEEVVKRTLEREVKTSGNYLYGEAVANTTAEAVKMAKSALVSEINREVLNNNDWQFAKIIQAKDVEYYVEMINLIRGDKFRAIAYIKKDNLIAVFQKDKTPEVKLSDKKASSPNLEKLQQEAVQVTMTVPATQDVQVVETAVQVETSEKQQPKVAVEMPASQIVVANQQTTNEGDLLEQIVSATSLSEIQTILISNKRKGNVVYGTMDKLIQPEAAYFIVYKQTGEIVAILDKGSDNARMDLISKEKKGKEIFNSNQVIWFQIFK